MATVEGGAGNDFLSGGPQADFILGFGGNDTLRAFSSGDTLVGGDGGDELTGGIGGDLFFDKLEHFEGDVITDFEPGFGVDFDRISIQFASPEVFNVVFTDVGADVRVSITNEVDGVTSTLTLLGLAGRNFEAELVSNAPLVSVDLFIVEEGQGPGDEGLVVNGTDASNLLFGSDFDDTIDGAGGPDTIVGGFGADIITTGGGGDNIFGQLGTFDGDTITDFTLGRLGEENVDVLTFSLTEAANIDVTFGEDGDDLLVTITDTDPVNGAVSETVTLLGYADLFPAFGFELGAGAPDGTAIAIFGVESAVEGEDDAFDAFGGQALSVAAGAGLLSNDEGDDLTVQSVNGTALINGELTLDLSDGDLTIVANGSFTFLADEDFVGVQTFDYVLTDGDVTDTASVSIAVEEPPLPVLSGTVGPDYISGADDDEAIFGQDGDDTIVGNGGADILDGGAGDDILIGDNFGPTAMDTFTTGPGSDTISGFVDQFAGDVVTDFTAGGVDDAERDVINVRTGSPNDFVVEQIQSGTDLLLTITDVVNGGAGTLVLQDIRLQAAQFTVDFQASDLGGTDIFLVPVPSLIPDELLAFWDIEEGSVLAAQEGADAVQAGTLLNGAAFDADGDTVLLDGSNDFIQIPHTDAFNVDEGALSVWFRTDGSSEAQGILGKVKNSFGIGEFLAQLLPDGRVVFLFENGLQTFSTLTTNSPVVTDNEFHHLTITWGDGEVRLYVDGVRQIGTVESNQHSPLFNQDGIVFPLDGLQESYDGNAGNTQPLLVGGVLPGTNSRFESYLNGAVDNVVLFDSLPTDDQIAALAANPNRAPIFDGGDLPDGSENNTAPEAADDTGLTFEVTPVTIDVLANDTDIDGNSLTIDDPGAAGNGTVEIVDGEIVYTPESGFSGTDAFTYTVTDGFDTDTATVTITVVPGAPPAPVFDLLAYWPATDETISTIEDVTGNGHDGALRNGASRVADGLVGGALAFDGVDDFVEVSHTPDFLLDEGGFSLWFNTDTTNREQGLLSKDAGFNGEGGHIDLRLLGSTLWVRLQNADAALDQVLSVPNAVTADTWNHVVLGFGPDGFSMWLNGTKVAMTGYRGGLGETSGGSGNAEPLVLGASLRASQPESANVPTQFFSGRIDEVATLTTQPDDTVVADLYARGLDGDTVFNPNTPPVATADNVATDEDTPVLIDVLANDIDGDGNALSIAGAADPANGTVTIDDGQILYTPDPDFNGTDTIAYTVSDGSDTANGSVAVTVNAVNDAPDAEDDTARTGINEAVAVDVLANDTDADGDVLTINDAGTAENGSVALEDGQIVYMPDADFEGVDTITYEITDGAETDTATLQVTVAAANTPPVAEDDTAETDEDTAVLIDVLGNDSDADDDALAIVDPGTPAFGSVEIVDGQIRYTPAADFNGTDSITYEISDGTDTATATAVITVTAINDAPVALDDEASTVANTTVTLDVRANDSDPEGDDLVVTETGTPDNGVVEIVDGAIVYTPAVGFFGTESFGYTLSDGALTDTATVTITVAPPVSSGDPDFPESLVALWSARNGALFGPDESAAPVPGGTLLNQAAFADGGETVAFDGTNDFVQIPHDDAFNLDEGALSVWFRTDDFANPQGIVGKITNMFGIGEFFVQLGTDGRLTLLFENGFQQFSTLTTQDPVITDTDWHQVTITWGDGEVRLYADGVRQTGTVESNQHTPLTGQDHIDFALGGFQESYGGQNGNDEPLTLGGILPGTGNGFESYLNGEIDTVFLLNELPSDQEIADLASNPARLPFFGGATPATLDLVDDQITTRDGEGVDLDLFGNDRLPDGDVSLGIGTGPANGTIEIFDQGTADARDDVVRYTPNDGFTGTDTFTYTSLASDSDGGTLADTATATVRVLGSVIEEAADRGLLALYTFDAGDDLSIVQDVSGYGAALDLTIADPGNVTWDAGTLTIDAATILESDGSADKLNEAIPATGALTIEAWIQTDDLDQSGPARIATLSGTSLDRNVTLGQVDDAVDVRLRTTETSPNGRPSLATEDGAFGTGQTHVVYACDDLGNATIWLDGEIAGSGTVDGTLNNWDSDFAFALANELDGGRPWTGTYDLVALYKTAFDAQTVAQHFAAGPDQWADLADFVLADDGSFDLSTVNDGF